MKKSTFQRIIKLPAAMAPMPTMPNWPRLMLPPHPVSTTSEMATMPHTTAKLMSTTVLGDAFSATNSTPAVSSAPANQIGRRTSGRCRSSAGIGLSTPALSHELSPVSARLNFSRRNSSAPRMTMRKVTSKIDSACTFQRIVHSAMPSPMPATSAAGSDLKRATTATARPGSSVASADQAFGRRRRRTAPW